jgi:hypothetical protein
MTDDVPVLRRFGTAGLLHGRAGYPPFMPASESTRTLSWLVGRWAPHLRIVSMSQPEPHLERLNVVATTSDPEAARSAVLDLEAEEIDDARIGLVALGAPTDEDLRPGVDPEGVTRTLAPRVVIGGAIGAVAGAAIGAGAAALAGAQAGYIVAAALAGAVLLSAIGAIWATFPRLGASDAYRQTFVDDAIDELNVVSLHTDDPAEAERAMSRLSSRDDLVVHLVDAEGAPVRPNPDR